MRTRTLLTLVCSLAATALFAGESSRFSQTLTADQRTATGVARLNSDQIAALDALVRLNLAQNAAEQRKAEQNKTAAAQPAAFTESLSVDQRRAAGLDQLTATEQAAVDSLVSAQVAPLPRHELATTNSVDAVEFFPNRFEVHGEVGFAFGAGSGGYSSREAWVSTTLLDTKTGTEFGVTVAAGREKWKRPWRYNYDWNEVGLSLSAPLFRAP